MTFTRMSAGYPYGISAFTEGRQYEFRTHSASAGNPDHPDIGRIFHPADPCQICCPVRAPVAQKAYDFDLIITHFIFISLSPTSLRQLPRGQKSVRKSG